MVKVVYLIGSHTNPEQVVRLVRVLKTGSPTSQVVIHHDYSRSHLDPTGFVGMNDVHVIEDYIPGKWGDFSLVAMELHAINWVLNHLKFDWLVFISGQDYPIQPLNQIEQFLETTNYDGFMAGVSLNAMRPCQPECPLVSSRNGKPCQDCTTRYYYQYYGISTGVGKILNQARKRLKKLRSLTRRRNLLDSSGQTGVIPFIGVRSFLSPFSKNFDCYKGTQWFTLNQRSVQYISQFVGRNPRFVNYFRRTIIPDEAFIQTILLNNPEFKICNDSKRFVTFRNSDVPHPEVLTVQDFDRIVASNQHFARKFDVNVDEEILTRLEHHIGTEFALSGNRYQKIERHG